MAIDNRSPKSTQITNNEVPSREGNPVLPQILLLNPLVPKGEKTRELIKWRVPGMGFVDMYINPQQLQIVEKKIITKQRTKGGFVIQYFGEELISITLNGHTGSSGVEGIEILRKVYRAEQEAFVKVEQQIADRLNSLSKGNTLSGVANDIKKKGLGGAIGGLISDSLGGAQNPPLLPTLASMANAVELYYQGWVFKGFFEGLTITESVSQGVGLFFYNISFTAISKRGTRTNFMPWHREPVSLKLSSGKNTFNHANNDITPPSFSGEED